LSINFSIFINFIIIMIITALGQKFFHVGTQVIKVDVEIGEVRFERLFVDNIDLKTKLKLKICIMRIFRGDFDFLGCGF